tara:strand:- start:50 stop:373 length:324 start_codon:yes stop_codon:yes gene_type:complete
MRRRFRQDILVTSPPPPPAPHRIKKINYVLSPFNIWFIEQIKKCGGLKTFSRESKISYNTAVCWTKKTNPDINSIYEISKYFGTKFKVPYMEIVEKIKELKRKKHTV